MTLIEDCSSTNMISENINNPLVKHIADQYHSVNINNATTAKIIMNNVRQRKVIESFLIKNASNMNIYQ